MALWRTRLTRVFMGRDVLALYLVALGFLTLSLLVEGSVLRVPGAILLVGFAGFQHILAPGITGIAMDIARAMYLYVLAVGVAFIYRTVRFRIVRSEA